MINYFSLKYLVDFFVSLALLLILFPFFLFFALLIFCVDNQLPFFVQVRSGQHGRPFLLFKFRTMRPSRSDDDLHSCSRVTSLGRIIRSLSIDELPQLVNIFLGDMSFVGPRPLLPEYIPLYSAYQSQRHLVRPGLTGLSQVSGRNLLSWKERFDLDVRYVHNVNLTLDLYLLFRTVFALFSRTSTVSSSTVIMQPFNGNN